MNSETQLRTKLPPHPRVLMLFDRWIATSPTSDDAAHDLAHSIRVATWTERLGHSLDVPAEWAWAAGLLHDCVNVPKNSPDRVRASTLCAEKANEILIQLGNWNEQEREQIFFAIRDHSYSRGAIPEYPLGKALQDADRLEALGAIGIMRTFSTGVKMGARYFDPLDPWAKNRPLDDLKFSVDHFYNKLLKLPDGFQTEAGRNEANRRAQTMKLFLKDLENEIT